MERYLIAVLMAVPLLWLTSCSDTSTESGVEGKSAASLSRATLPIDGSPNRLNKFLPSHAGALTSPAEGDVWRPGKRYTIKWNQNLLDGAWVAVILYKSKSSNKNWKKFDHYISGNYTTKNDGKFSWKIPSTQTKREYDVVVWEYSAAGGWGDLVYSDVFSIGDPTITVTTPNGGEKWFTGKRYTIEWTQKGSRKPVKIQLLKGGRAYKTIHNRTKDDGKHSWKIPSSIPTATSYRLKITSTSDSSISDSSNKKFTITKTSDDDGNGGGGGGEDSDDNSGDECVTNSIFCSTTQ